MILTSTDMNVSFKGLLTSSVALYSVGLFNFRSFENGFQDFDDDMLSANESTDAWMNECMFEKTERLNC